MLPAQVCGTTAFKLSIATGALGAGAAAGAAGALGGLLSGLGSATSFSFAIATVDPAAGVTCDTTFLAIQAQGADASTFLGLMAQEATKNGGSTSQASLGGKNVTVVTPSGGGKKSYFYTNGDTLFGVEAPDDTTAGQALSQLP